MKNNIFKLMAVIIVAVLGLIFFLNKDNLFVSEKEAEKQEVMLGKVSLVIDMGEGNNLVSENEIQEGMTAFTLLENKARELGLVLEIKNYDIGVMIEKVGSKKNGEDDKYWLYYVNGEMPMISADKNIIKAGDKVEFKFEKSSF